MAERTASRLIKLGVLLVALGPIPALMGALTLAAIPALAVATHVTMMATGVMLMSLGLIWETQVRLDEAQQKTALWLLVGGAFGAVVTGFLAALVGIGGEALSALAGDTIGSPGEERLVRVLSIAAGLSVLGGLALVRVGVRRDTTDMASAAALERMTTRFIHLGVTLLMLGTALAVLTAVTPVELPVVTPVALVILGLIALSLALIWADVQLEEGLQHAAFRLLAGGAAGMFVTGVLAWLLLSEPEALSGSYTGLFGSQGWQDSVTEVGALLSVLAVAVGIAIVWHGLPKNGPRTEGALAVPANDHVSTRLRRVGALLLLLGIVAALLPSMARLPRVALGTAATVLIIGPMLICFGVIWPRIRLSENRQRTASSLLSYGAFGILVSGMVLGLLGIGGDTLSVSAAGHEGSPGQEAVAKIAVDLSALLIFIGMVMVWFGVRGPAVAPSWRRRVAWITGYGIAVLALQATIYHVLPNVLFGEAYPLQLMEYDYGEPDRTMVLARIADDGSFIVEDPSDATRAGYDGREVQGWTPDEWQWFYHASQGGAFELPVPYDWMMALEQPTVPLWPRSEVDLLMTSTYLTRFGFLTNAIQEYDTIPRDSRGLGLHRDLVDYSRINEESVRRNNPNSLPVGFARAEDWVDHSTGTTFDAMGFTCAACHTGQVDWVQGDTLWRIRIEGGPATVHLGKFRSAVGMSLALTSMLPGRFDRFARRLEATGEEKVRLRERFDALLERGGDNRALQDSLGIYPTDEGFSRLDATGRAANFILGSELGQDRNLQVANAPVNFPHIWDSPWFEWVQYNASFQQPMMRNAAEGLGVFAAVDLRGSGPDVPAWEDPLLFASSMDVISIHEMEKLLAGPDSVPFSGLRSPEWPAAFDSIDQELRQEGAGLYASHCAACHLPGSVDTTAFYAPVNWTEATDGRSYLKTPVSNFSYIGTDPLAAANFRNRTVDLGDLGRRLGLAPREYEYREALTLLIGSVKEKRYEDLGIDVGAESVRQELDGHRPAVTQAVLGYRARPLNGIWATPPFLHNGSVPTLYQVLGPQEDRPDRFWLGSREFDQEHVGFDYSETPGAFEFDTSQPGNSNRGHLFEGDSATWNLRGRQGVIGPSLDHRERMAIIEYLKSLPPLPPPPR